MEVLEVAVQEEMDIIPVKPFHTRNFRLCMIFDVSNQVFRRVLKGTWARQNLFTCVADPGKLN